MTVWNLLTHTSGLTYGFFADNPVEEMYRNSTYADATATLEESILELSRFPLVFQPGTQWRYSVATDVCGYLIELLAETPLDTFFEERLFAPLGMSDTAFHVTDANSDRFASLYTHDADDGSLRPHRNAGSRLSGDFMARPKSPFGGHGLVSTIEDYLKFTRMLLDGGESEGTRFIGRKTLEYMTMNHIPIDMFPSRIGDDVLSGMGYGLGFSVVMEPARTGVLNSIGSYGWDGAAATNFSVDPREKLIGIIMT